MSRYCAKCMREIEPRTPRAFTRETARNAIGELKLRGRNKEKSCWYARVTYWEKEEIGDRKVIVCIGTYDSRERALEACEFFKATGQKIPGRIGKVIMEERSSRIQRYTKQNGTVRFTVSTRAKKDRQFIGSFDTIEEAEAAQAKYQATGEKSLKPEGWRDELPQLMRQAKAAKRPSEPKSRPVPKPKQPRKTRVAAIAVPPPAPVPPRPRRSIKPHPSGLAGFALLAEIGHEAYMAFVKESA